MTPITIKPTVIDLREGEKWQELGLISDQFLVSEQAVIDRSLIWKEKKVSVEIFHNTDGIWTGHPPPQDIEVKSLRFCCLPDAS